MQTFKPSPDELPALKKSAQLLKDANKRLAIAKKEADAAKADIAGWLKANRQLDVETLRIGDLVIIEGVVMIETTARNQFDEKGFSIAHPAQHEEWKKDFPINRYKALA